MAVRWHELGEVENECTLHNSIVLAIFVPKIIKVGGNLTKFWRKQFWLFFETRCSSQKTPSLGVWGTFLFSHAAAAILLHSGPIKMTFFIIATTLSTAINNFGHIYTKENLQQQNFIFNQMLIFYKMH